MQDLIGKMLKLNKIDDGKGGTGGTPPKPEDVKPPAAGDPPAKKDGDKEFDELGYEIVPPKDSPPGDKKPEGDPPPKDPTKKPEEVEPGTGYGKEPPKVEDAPPGDPPPKKEDAPPPTDLEKKLEAFAKPFADKIKLQITELGLEGEKLDKFIALRTQEVKDAEAWTKNQQAEMKRQSQLKEQGWHKELKEDPVFGGDKFPVNLARSEKVLAEYLPELKKELTEAGAMLRPSVMRGLARLADQLYPDRKMVQGDPPPSKEETDKDKPNNPLDFYQ